MELGQESALKNGHSFVLKVSLKRKGSSVYKDQWEVASVCHKRIGIYV